MRTLRTLLSLVVVAGCTGVPDGIEPVRFDAARYLGTWVEIARLDHRFERGLTNVTATYGVAGDRITVRNRGWNPSRCDWAEVEGTARFLVAPDVASLAVQFFWPLEGGYHVFALSPDYETAVVSGPTRSYLWLLARRADIDAADRDAMVAAAAAAGFDTDGLIFVTHDEPVCLR